MTNTSFTFNNTVSITVNGQVLTGFKSVRVSRGIEKVPAEFEISLAKPNVVIKPPQDVIIKFGSDVILTGRIDSATILITPTEHSITIRGVSNFYRMTRGAAIQAKPAYPGDPNITLNAGVFDKTIFQLAQQLASPYDLTVSGNGNSIQIPITQFNLGETGYQILELASRWAQCLIYDDVNGNVVCSKVGASKMASGVVQGQIKQGVSVSDVTNVFSDYYVTYSSVATLGDVQLPGQAPPSVVHGYAQDKGMAAANVFLPTIIVSEQTMNAQDVANQLAAWECNRRWGRSQSFRCVIPSWRDNAGTLWAPNSLMPINAPQWGLSNVTWLISDVTFNLDVNGGTTADLTLMPPEAFDVQPAALTVSDADALTTYYQVQNAQNANNINSSTTQVTLYPNGPVNSP